MIYFSNNFNNHKLWSLLFTRKIIIGIIGKLITWKRNQLSQSQCKWEEEKKERICIYTHTYRVIYIKFLHELFTIIGQSHFIYKTKNLSQIVENHIELKPLKSFIYEHTLCPQRNAFHVDTHTSYSVLLRVYALCGKIVCDLMNVGLIYVHSRNARNNVTRLVHCIYHLYIIPCSMFESVENIYLINKGKLDD